MEWVGFISNKANGTSIGTAITMESIVPNEQWYWYASQRKHLSVQCAKQKTDGEFSVRFFLGRSFGTVCPPKCPGWMGWRSAFALRHVRDNPNNNDITNQGRPDASGTQTHIHLAEENSSLFSAN